MRDSQKDFKKWEFVNEEITAEQCLEGLRGQRLSLCRVSGEPTASRTRKTVVQCRPSSIPAIMASVSEPHYVVHVDLRESDERCEYTSLCFGVGPQGNRCFPERTNASRQLG